MCPLYSFNKKPHHPRQPPSYEIRKWDCNICTLSAAVVACIFVFYGRARDRFAFRIQHISTFVLRLWVYMYVVYVAVTPPPAAAIMACYAWGSEILPPQTQYQSQTIRKTKHIEFSSYQTRPHPHSDRGIRKKKRKFLILLWKCRAHTMLHKFFYGFCVRQAQCYNDAKRMVAAV